MVQWYPQPSPLPDIEQVLNPWLQAQLSSVFGTTAQVMAETTDNLQSQVPVVRLYRVTGSDKEYPMLIDVATINVDSFGADRGSASELARQVHMLLITMAPGASINGAAIGDVDVVAGPRWLAYADINVRRFNAAYAVTFKTA